METVRVTYQVRANWLARAILSGFVADVAMLFTFIISYGLATLLAGVELTTRQGLRVEVVRQWFHALTDNPLIQVAQPNLYASMAAHVAVGLTFAVIYAYFFEPRLSGPSWQRGLVFSLLPWVLSLVVFFPLVGAGPFGFALGAGPLPLVGNFILHVAYGVTLGVLYGPFGDLVTDSSFHPPGGDDVLAMQSSERMAARGIVLGLGLGIALGAAGALVAQLSPQPTFLGLNPLIFVVATALFGASFGGLIGSLVGLPSAGQAS